MPPCHLQGPHKPRAWGSALSPSPHPADNGQVLGHWQKELTPCFLEAALKKTGRRHRIRGARRSLPSTARAARAPPAATVREPRRQPRSGTSHPRTAQGSFQRCTDAPFSPPVTSLPWHFRDSGLRTDKRSHWKRQPREAGYRRGRQSCSFAKDDSKARHSLSCNTHLFSRARMLKTSKKKKKAAQVQALARRPDPDPTPPQGCLSLPRRTLRGASFSSHKPS